MRSPSMAIAPSHRTPFSFLRGSVRTCLPRSINISDTPAPDVCRGGFRQNTPMRTALALCVALFLAVAEAQELPIFDAHLHYSHDAWDLVPVDQAIAILRKAGLK